MNAMAAATSLPLLLPLHALQVHIGARGNASTRAGSDPCQQIRLNRRVRGEECDVASLLVAGCRRRVPVHNCEAIVVGLAAALAELAAGVDRLATKATCSSLVDTVDTARYLRKPSCKLQAVV